MSDIDWDSNAVKAVKEFYRWANAKHRAGCSADTDKFFSEIDLQRKTVSDVYEKWPHGWPFSSCEYKYCGYSLVTNDFFMYPDGFEFVDGRGYFVCTREELEAYSKERKAKQAGDEWTHKDAFGGPCRVLIDEPDAYGNVVIFRGDGWYATVAASSLKPIKPKLTKKEYDACAVLADYFKIDPSDFDEYMSRFDSELI